MNFLYPYLSGYKKGFNNHIASVTFAENWGKCLDRKDFDSAILMNFSKVFDTLNHDLLIVELHAYGFQHDALKLATMI